MGLTIDANVATWHAWYNVMPPGPSTFHVKGEVDVGNTSDSATLVYDSLLKSNPPILVLRVEYQTIIVARPDGDTKVRLHYSIEGSPGKYGAVQVVLDGKIIAEIKELQIAT